LHALAKAGVKQLPLSVSTCVRRKGRCGLTQEGNGAFLGFIVLDGEVDRARAAIDGHKQVAFASLSICGLQLWQMLDVDVDEAKVVVAEGTLSLGRAFGEKLCPSVQTFGLEDAPDAVAVKVRQEMGDDKGEIVEREVGGTPQAADNSALFFSGFPR
jgi:hypothetical protein